MNRFSLPLGLLAAALLPLTVGCVSSPSGGDRNADKAVAKAPAPDVPKHAPSSVPTRTPVYPNQIEGVNLYGDQDPLVVATNGLIRSAALNMARDQALRDERARQLRTERRLHAVFVHKLSLDGIVAGADASNGRIKPPTTGYRPRHYGPPPKAP